MTADFNLTPTQLEDFERRGVLHIPGLFAADNVQRALDHVRGCLGHLGLWKHNAWHLDAAPRPEWPASGITTRQIGNRHPAVDALLQEPALRRAVDTLLAGHAIDTTFAGRLQLLITLPNSNTWTVPTAWHVDYPRLASGRRPGVQVFAFLDTVAARGGGTLVVAGSHRLLNTGRFIRSKDLKSRLGAEAFFRELFTAAPGAERSQLRNWRGAAGGVELEILELTGHAGDAYLTDLRVLHTGAPNTAAQPRLMVTHRYLPADVVPELTDGFWGGASQVHRPADRGR